MIVHNLAWKKTTFIILFSSSTQF